MTVARRRGEAVAAVPCRNLLNFFASATPDPMRAMDPLVPGARISSSIHSGGASRVFTSRIACGKRTAAFSSPSLVAALAASNASSVSRLTRTSFVVSRWNATRRYRVRTDGISAFASNSPSRISSASRRAESLRSSPERRIKRSRSPLPSTNAGRSRRSKRKRSFTLTSVDQLSWCVLRSTKTTAEASAGAEVSFG